MSDTTDLATLKSSLQTFATFLRTEASKMESGARYANAINGIADELDYIRLNLVPPTNQVFGNR